LGCFWNLVSLLIYKTDNLLTFFIKGKHNFTIIELLQYLTLDSSDF